MKCKIIKGISRHNHLQLLEKLKKEFYEFDKIRLLLLAYDQII